MDSAARHPHSHGPDHENAADVERRAAVLDVGDDVGAMVLYTTPDLDGAEIEVSPLVELQRRTHSQVHRRSTGVGEVYAALYLALPAGTYRIWDDDPDRVHEVTITGGEVAEIDWR